MYSNPLVEVLNDNNEIHGRSFEVKHHLPNFPNTCIPWEKSLFPKHGVKNSSATPNIELRFRLGIINEADCLGCDSVGQHMAYVLENPATVVVGSTFKENTPTRYKILIIDMGEGAEFQSPRITMDELTDRTNEGIMDE